MTQDIIHTADGDGVSEKDKAMKIQALRDMINNAEQTIQSAKAMLLQVEGKKKAGRKRKVEEIENGSIIQGTFDGQVMMGTDGKRYPIPANYASKSKLVQGDFLKLTITPDSSFIYKQIGPIERKHAIGIVTQDETGNYLVLADGKGYRVLLASITYFKAEPGDEVAIMLPRDLTAEWAALDSVLQKGGGVGPPIPVEARPSAVNMEEWKDSLEETAEETALASPTDPSSTEGLGEAKDEKRSAIQETQAEEEEEEEVDIAPNRSTDQTSTDDVTPMTPTPSTDENQATPATPPAHPPEEADALRQSIINEWLESLKQDKSDTNPTP